MHPGAVSIVFKILLVLYSLYLVDGGSLIRVFMHTV